MQFVLTILAYTECEKCGNVNDSKKKRMNQIQLQPLPGVGRGIGTHTCHCQDHNVSVMDAGLDIFAMQIYASK